AVGRVQAEEAHPAGRRVAQAEHEADGSRLAGAVRAEQCHHLTRLNAQVDALQRLNGAVALAGCDQFHDGSHCCCPRSSSICWLLNIAPTILPPKRPVSPSQQHPAALSQCALWLGPPASPVPRAAAAPLCYCVFQYVERLFGHPQLSMRQPLRKTTTPGKF